MKQIFSTLKSWWMRFAEALGWVNTHLILTIFYLFIIGVGAIIIQLIRKDLLNRSFTSKPTYWTDKEAIQHTIEQAKHQF